MRYFLEVVCIGMNFRRKASEARDAHDSISNMETINIGSSVALQKHATVFQPRHELSRWGCTLQPQTGEHIGKIQPKKRNFNGGVAAVGGQGTDIDIIHKLEIR